MENEKEFWIKTLKIITSDAMSAYQLSQDRELYPKAHYGEDICSIEMFSRITYGLLPLIYNTHDVKLIQFFNSCICIGTNRQSESFWGIIKHSDQRCVEMLPICLTLLFNRKETWDTYSAEQKQSITEWMLQINDLNISGNNWLFFRIIVNIIFDNLNDNNSSYSQLKKKSDLRIIDDLYVGNGWYYDGKEKRIDYYSAFAFHFYGLLYSLLCDDDYSEIFRQRANEFSYSFIYFFSNDGSSIPYGRSLTYKMAMSAFWSMLSLAGGMSFDKGTIKGIIFRNLRWWMDKDIFDDKGMLTVGYTYPNLFMSEEYNAYGSSYWALKAFVFLLIDDKDIFWGEPQKSLPILDNRVIDYYGHYAIARDDEHIALFPNNGCTGSFIECFQAKYLKFVYSNYFGFSVPRGYQSFKEEGLDSVISVSVDNEVFFPRNQLLAFRLTESFLYSSWEPISGVTIHSYIVPGVPWHTRVHYIETELSIMIRDAGFCVDGNKIISQDDNSLLISGKTGLSGLICYSNPDNIKYEHLSANTNIYFPICNVPYCEWNIKRGKYIICESFYGSKTMVKWEEKPDIRKIDNLIKIDIEQHSTIINPRGYSMKSKTGINRLKKHTLSYLRRVLK